MLFFLKKEFRISTNLFFFFLLQHEFTFKLCFNELSIQVLVLKASSATKYFFFLKCLKKMQHAVLTEIIQYFYKLLLYVYIYKLCFMSHPRICIMACLTFTNIIETMNQMLDVSRAQ